MTLPGFRNNSPRALKDFPHYLYYISSFTEYLELDRVNPEREFSKDLKTGCFFFFVFFFFLLLFFFSIL